MSYSLHPEAETELAVAAAFYKQQAGVALASAFLAEFIRVADLLIANPGLGTPTEGELRVYPCAGSRTRLSTASRAQASAFSSSVVSIVGRATGAAVSEPFSREAPNPFIERTAQSPLRAL